MGYNFLIYGATGYTGKLAARLAKEKGLNPLLSGRDEEKLRAVAEPLGFDYVVASLNNETQLDAAIADVQAVLHIAGPFSATSQPMFEACLRTKTHYIDITGEIDVFESLYHQKAKAKAAGIMVMSGAGFDVVPTDCVAAYLKDKLPDAVSLKLYIQGLERPTRGTYKTIMESIDQMVRVRHSREIVALSKPKVKFVDFGDGEVECLTTSWADVSAAYYTTGIPNIEVYFKVMQGMKLGFSISRYGGWFLKSNFIQRSIKKRIDKYPEGPSDKYRANHRSVIIGEVEDQSGAASRVKITTCEGYTFTAHSCIGIANKVANGDFIPGFHTPAGHFGPDLVLEFGEVSREDL